MYELVFDTKISENGNLYCPKEFLFENANYKVIVNFNDVDSENFDAENAAILDNSDEFLSKDEVKYYLNLD